jgi:hypothetical protein
MLVHQTADSWVFAGVDRKAQLRVDLKVLV